ncbi:hypothetical protein HHL16_18815 [Pseudoflavitalea sp. G-6-1-2]|uniref:hypothetical protein n=1 Tax=Pseudoflavitalea sp. G-6-1-2 TaxID=2728841 RepID=UPI00146D8842|nr:hypothetical protein [Pseudoflavitalea sp. G-6-1-2]NML22936.1 hypothetical protein [Pseudoflavitalea sp. G-6-1-2]
MLPLKTTLLVNAISSGFTGILLAAMPGMVAGIFGVNNTVPFFEVGVFLILFAAFVLIVATRKPISIRSVTIVTTLDILWVIGSIIAAMLLAGVVSTIGIVLIVAVAAWVALMALLQFKGSKTVNAAV